MARFTFFIGKGGVGKTTVSSAYAVHCASKNRREKVLLVSTDPAHSLADVLETKLSDEVRQVKGSPGILFSRQIDPEKEVRRFVSEQREHLLQVVESGTFFTRDEIEPLLDASLPGMAELAAILAVDRLADAGYGRIVVDTAPIGHTLRMFGVPRYLEKFLEFLETASSRDQAIARQFAGRRLKEMPAVTLWREMVERVRALLSSSEIMLVTTPETFALQESWRATEQLQTLGLRLAGTVLNRVVDSGDGCARCSKKAREAKRATAEVRKRLPGGAVFKGDDPGCPILGVEALGKFGAHVFEHRALRLRVQAPRVEKVKMKRAEWPTLSARLNFTVGKGGVGKTTIAAALAVQSRAVDRAEMVTICSIDPAPSLDDIFETDVGEQPSPVLGDTKLRAAELDAVSAFRNWAEPLKDRIESGLAGEREGLHVDLSFDRRTLAALLEITPPGIDEIFAVFRMRELTARGGTVIVDMAPTGHALEVLRTPERMLVWARLLLKSLSSHRTLALARDAAVEIASVAQEVRQFRDEVTDSRLSQAWPVLLPEPLPDHETERLLEALSAEGISFGGLFVNRVLMSKSTGDCVRCKRAMRWQAATLSGLKQRFKKLRIYCIPEAGQEIKGKKRLSAFTRQIWELQ